MLKIIKKIFKTGIITADTTVTRRAAVAIGVDCGNDSYSDYEFTLLGNTCHQLIQANFGGSFAIRHVDAGSCNGCELGLHALNNVFYNLERFGVHFVASPRHADALLVTGVVARHMEAALRITYINTPQPKLVIAVGNCAVSGGEFGENYASCGQVSNVIPVDLNIHGCPPTPHALLTGITRLLKGRI